MDNLFYTQEEFNKIRDDIVGIFDGELENYFKVKRSTYKWSSKHRWIINVDVTWRWNYSYEEVKLDRDTTPKGRLLATSLLFNKMIAYIEDEDNKFHFTGVDTRDGFGFNFVFQPLVMVAKDMLNR